MIIFYNLHSSILTKATGFMILLLFICSAQGQVRNISGVINTTSTGIDSIFSRTNTDVDTLIVKNVTGFAVKDTVLVIQMAGAKVSRTGSFNGTMGDIRNTGKYAIFIIKAINPARKMVILNTSLFNYNPLQNGESGQMVKVATFKRVRVEATLTCEPYDPVTGTGGILAMLVEQSLTLNANIDVSGKGFPGGDPRTDSYLGICATGHPELTDSFYHRNSADTAAMKGFGIYDTLFHDTRGRGPAINGGGGGNGKYAGGGGGSHYGVGGVGGKESDNCVTPLSIGGEGGKADVTTYYANTGQARIFMGGGGGTGNQNPGNGKNATRGGAGGGIIIIISDTIIGNGNKIMSQGGSVGALSTAGAGGGGAGGAIFIHAFKYDTNATQLTFDVKGGSGGSVAAGPNSAGPGGGGGSGIIWFNNPSIPASPVLYSVNGGLAGKFGTQGLGAGNGGTGGAFSIKAGLQIQIRGFLFNKLPDGQTICEGETPTPVFAPPAAGGDGTFTYLWEQSNDLSTWNPAQGTNNSFNYVPGVLTDTTYYRRIVDDGIIPKDTSRILDIIVHPKLNNNIVSPDTTVCTGLTANSLYAITPVTGALGSGTYTYSWEQSPDNSLWSPASGTNNVVIYNTPVLNDTTFYRRTVNSGACESISNSVRISVLDPLSGNTVNANQTICYNQTFTQLTAGTVSGGEPSDRDYLWQQNYTGTWTDTAASENFTPLTLARSVRYRRIVLSGLDNTCQNTSNEVQITVLPKLANNNILNSDSVYCAGIVLDSLRLLATQPTGGESPDYAYIWQKRSLSGSWTVAQTNGVLIPYNAGVLYDTTLFRRLVFSGPGNVCKDTSLAVTMNILPELGNNLISSPQVICINEIPAGLTGALPSGGNGTVSAYLWQKSPEPLVQTSWVNATGVNNVHNYSPPSLSSTTYYRRIVNSGPVAGTCRDTAVYLKIEVQNDISNNTITADPVEYTCYGTIPGLLNATAPGTGGLGGGDGTNYAYTWLESINGSTWVPAVQTRTNSTYQAEALTFPKYYKRYVLSGACKDTSVLVKIDTTHNPVLFTLNAQQNSFCFVPSVPNARLNVTIHEGYAPYTIGYSDGQAGTGTGNLSTRSGVINPSVINPPDSIMYTYRIQSITDRNGCVASSANLSGFNVAVKVFSVPAPVFSQKYIEVCDSTLTISPVPGIGHPQWEYIAETSRNMYVPVTTSGAAINLKANFYLNNDFDSEAYLVYREFKANCQSEDSIHAVFFKTPQAMGNLYRVSGTNEVPFGDTLVIFISDNQNLKADNVTMGIPLWTITEGPAVFSNTNTTVTSLSDLDEDTPTTFEYSINNGICPPNKRTVNVIRKDFKMFDGFSPNDDGVNDVLYASGLYDPEIEFRFLIFSSQGTFIREITRDDIVETDFTKNEIVLWDGTTRIGGADNKIPNGTYYYVLTVKYKNQSYDKKGYIIVRR